MTSREKTAPLRREVGHWHRHLHCYGALDDEKKGEKVYCEVTATDQREQTKIMGGATSLPEATDYCRTVRSESHMGAGCRLAQS